MISSASEGNIVYVSPYLVPKSNNIAILSQLKPIITDKPSDDETLTIAKESIAIPVAANIDVSHIIEENTAKLVAARASVYHSAWNDDLDDEIGQNGTLSINDNEDPKHFTTIESLYPKTMKDQLSIVVIMNFPNVRRFAIEKILAKMTSASFRWSLINYEFIDNKCLFVKFDLAKSAFEFHRYLTALITSISEFSSIKASIDASLADYFKGEEALDVEVPEKTISSIRQILRNKNVVEKSGKLSDDVDEVSSYYRNYKVDNNELIDVPNNMKELIVKDIIKFRSSVLMIERENRKMELELERQKTKQRLKKFVEDIKETNEDTAMEESKESSENKVDEFEDLNDEEYEKYLRDRDHESLESEYQRKLSEVNKVEVNERQFLLKKLTNLKNYENNLLEQKMKYIDDLRLGLEDKDKLPPALGLYYQNHSQYLKYRVQKRTNEELLDAKDEQEEAEAQKRHQPEIVLPISKSEPSEPKIEQSIKVSELPPAKFELLQVKITELVEEYLGIKDDYLTETVMENLKNNNLDARDELISELTEVLDEDAINLVDDLFAFIGKGI